MVVADGSACLRPDLFLRVEVRTGRWKMNRLQAWMGSEEVADELGGVPRCAVKEKQNRLGRIGDQYILEKQAGRLSRQAGGGQRELVTGRQVECPIEMDVVA